jgi:GNAT superfamily N-acetyltransferase
LSIFQRSAVRDDFEFSFRAKLEALGPHVSKRWLWEDTFQRAIHEKRWNEKPWFIIERDSVNVGTFTKEKIVDGIQFGEFYLLPRFQHQGIGTKILETVIAESESLRLPIRLEYLKWNPVGVLYARVGFVVTSENETHYFAERAVQNNSSCS